VSDRTLQQLCRELDDVGFVLLPDAVPPRRRNQLRDRLQELFELEGEQAGAEFKQEPGCGRLANLVDKGAIFRWAITLPTVQPLIAHILGDFKLSSLNARSVRPGHLAAQPLHVDMGALPDDRGDWVANVVWMLDDFTPENGAPRVIPGSQRWNRRPQDELADPTAPHPDEVLLTGTAGTLAVMNAHLWHGGTANRTDQPRLALHAFYCRRDKPQQQYQKRLLSPETQSALSSNLRHLLAVDDPLNDRLSAEVAVRSGFLK